MASMQMIKSNNVSSLLAGVTPIFTIFLTAAIMKIFDAERVNSQFMIRHFMKRVLFSDFQIFIWIFCVHCEITEEIITLEQKSNQQQKWLCSTRGIHVWKFNAIVLVSLLLKWFSIFNRNVEFYRAKSHRVD